MLRPHLMTVITQLLLWTKLLSLFTILGSSIMSTYKRLICIRPLSCGFDSSLVEHCTGITEVVGSNPTQSLKFFSGLCSSSVTATLALMTVITQLLRWTKLLSEVDCVCGRSLFVKQENFFSAVFSKLSQIFFHHKGTL